METSKDTRVWCPACERLISTNRDGTFRRHKGGDAFDAATDGICSNSNSLPEESQKFVVSTPGPLFLYEGTIADIRRHMENSFSLRRGWTMEWFHQGRLQYLRVRNSKGKVQTGCCVCPLRLSPSYEIHKDERFTKIPEEASR